LKIEAEPETTVAQSEPRLSTAEEIAEQHGVSRETVKRAGQFAAAVDKLGLGEEVANGQVEASRKDIIKAATALPENPTPDQVEEAKKHVHVSKNSGNNEWYTPTEYIEAATALMGRIDLDPASSPKANETVRAAKFYTAEEDGRDKDWSGNIWMNPPYAQPLIGEFSAKLAEACESGAVENACVLVNNATETAWFQRLLDVADAVCFPRSRIRFLDPEGNPGAPLQGQAVIYTGSQTERFCILFSKFGQCLMK
jgi:phage N-6-adenine-methyltransferase